MRQTPRIRILLSKKPIHCIQYVTSVIIRLKNVNECLHETLRERDGIEIMEEFLNQREVKDYSTKSLRDLATIILKNNLFVIGEKVYHQLLGTAIGTKFAPTYPNLFMDGLDNLDI